MNDVFINEEIIPSNRKDTRMSSEQPNRRLRVSYTNGATIPSGKNYANQKPSYTITQEIDIDDPMWERKLVEQEAKEQIGWMKNYVDDMVKKDMSNMKESFGYEPLPEHHRITVIDGVKYPHVTNIITPDRPKIKFLDEHAELGTKLDEVMKIYIDTGIYAYDDFEDKGNISQTFDEVFSEMYLNHLQEGCNSALFNSINLYTHSIKVVSDGEYNYCGELDALATCKVRGQCIVDFKKTKNLTRTLQKKYFMQMAAYSNAMETKPDNMIIVTPYTYIISRDIDSYIRSFMSKRKEYKMRFGI